VRDIEHRDAPPTFINAVDHAVGPTTRTVSVIEGRVQPLTHLVRILAKRSDDEFVGCEGYGCG